MKLFLNYDKKIKMKWVIVKLKMLICYYYEHKHAFVILNII